MTKSAEGVQEKLDIVKTSYVASSISVRDFIKIFKKKNRKSSNHQYAYMNMYHRTI